MTPRESVARRMVRRPGLYRRWELREVLGIGGGLHFEEDGAMADGTVLWAIYDSVATASDKVPVAALSDWITLPAAYRASDFDLPAAGGDWKVEEIGHDAAGEALYRLHCRMPRAAAGKAGALKTGAVS